MPNFIRKSLMGKTVVSFVAVLLAAIVAVGYISFYSAKASLEQDEFEKIRAIRFQQENALVTYFQSTKDQLTFLAKTRRGIVGLEALIAVRDESEKASSAVRPGEYEQAVSGLTEAFSTFLEMNKVEDGYEELFVMDARDGTVLYAGKRLENGTMSVTTRGLRETDLGKLANKVISTKRPAMSDMAIYPPTGAPGMFLGLPMLSRKDQKLEGVLVVRLNANKIGEIIRLNPGAGNTVRTYLVGQDLTLRSSSRLDADSAMLKTTVDTEVVKEALSGHKGQKTTRDFRGEEVLSAFQALGLDQVKDLGLDFRWALVTQIDRSEAIEPAKILGFRIMVAALVIGLAAAGIAFVMARSTAKPIVMLAEVANGLASGDLTVRVPELKRSDEIRVLGDTFRLTIESLRRQIGRILEGVNVLSSSVTQVGATISEIAASAAQTSSAVTETTTTVEQVKQAAKLSSERARSVAQSAQTAVQISSAGKGATERIIEQMNLIQGQMGSIGETVVRLSEHSQSIESIIDSVHDLADQSNLLAVNASIEAARAGEQGRGFSIVAQEIKSLADQSKRSTDEVRTVLDETRKWVNAVVMVTEQGAKAVHVGVQQSVQAGEAIGQLSASVAESSHSASVIQSSSEQQAIGVAQVSTAMTSIEEAMRQISESTGQLVTAAQGLGDLGGELRELVQHYKM